MKSLEELQKNEIFISERYRDEDGNLIRIVDGKKIIQIEEKTPEDRIKNELINLWRIRRK